MPKITADPRFERTLDGFSSDRPPLSASISDARCGA
jgi:hypothetical protein